jgi:hypothetical protein
VAPIVFYPLRLPCREKRPQRGLGMLGAIRGNGAGAVRDVRLPADPFDSPLGQHRHYAVS